MGYWNATCNLSNLPIMEGDKVVLIPLVRVNEKPKFNCTYPNDTFMPLGFPMVGVYNGYGGLENMDTTETNREYFRSLDFYFLNRDNKTTEKYVRVPEYSNFEVFVNCVLCIPEGCYVDVQSKAIFKDGKAEINYMLVHYQLYQMLCQNVGNRVSYGQTECLERFLYKNFEGILNEKLSWLADQQKELNSSEDMDSRERLMFDALERRTLNEISESIFSKNEESYRRRWNYFSNLLMKGLKKEELLNYAVEKVIFYTVLSLMRKGYLCDSGCGSSSEETKLHLILAEFIKIQIMENTEKYDDMVTVEGVEEFVYF